MSLYRCMHVPHGTERQMTFGRPTQVMIRQATAPIASDRRNPGDSARRGKWTENAVEDHSGSQAPGAPTTVDMMLSATPNALLLRW